MVRLTERAAEHVLALMREDPEALALRVAVQGGGCSGLQYALGFDGEPQPGDEVADQHGVKVVVDRFSLPYLSGAEVDFTYLPPTMSRAGVRLPIRKHCMDRAWRLEPAYLSAARGFHRRLACSLVRHGIGQYS